tara:strand:+ start:651 stop:1268 length:618 start_codon:yes stop_codon:yes gene_type:complete
MARKNLLTESEVRRFMKLANMGQVGAKRLEEISYLDEVDEEAELHATEDELGAEDEFADEEGAELDALEDEPMDDLGGEEEGEMDPDLEEKLKAAIMAIADEWDIADVVSVEEVPGDEEEMAMEPEGDVDLDAVEMEMGPEGEEDVMAMDVEEEPPVAMRDTYQEALVKKVAQRVATRLMQEHKNEKLATELTERIFNRITSKSS